MALQPGVKSKSAGSFIPTGPITLGPSEVSAFEALKKAMADHVVLHLLQPDRPFVIHSDASKLAIGGVLEQHDEKGNLRPVAFFSRKLTGVGDGSTSGTGQRKWSVREKETYALVACLRKWAPWIGLQPVTVHTDHKSIADWVQEVFDTPSGPAGRRGRWHEFLSRFNLEILYIRGEDNVVGDAASRWMYPAGAAEDVCFDGGVADRDEVAAWDAEDHARVVEELRQRGNAPPPLPAVTRLQRVAAAPSDAAAHTFRRWVSCCPPSEDVNLDLEDANDALADTDLRSDMARIRPVVASAPLQDDEGVPFIPPNKTTVMTMPWHGFYHRDPKWSTTHAALVAGRVIPDHELRGDRVYHRRRMVVPVALTSHVVAWVHACTHRGQRPTEAAVARAYDVQGLPAVAAKVVRTCAVCQACNPPTQGTPGDLRSAPVPHGVFDAVAIDLVSLPEAKWEGTRYDCAIVVTDRLSGFVHAVPCTKKGATSEAVATAYYGHVTKLFGLPGHVTTAHDSAFVGSF
jgi:hypothetical protein